MRRTVEPAEVWTGPSGAPERLVWRARRYRVSDTPTPLVGPADWWHPFDGHDVAPGRAPLAITGWRFQASADDGETHVFDVGHDGRHWQVFRVFD
ncbi:hypothetical protein AVP42_01228 [Agromyces sp. NDB4Y10]|uniref:Nucleotidyltransferase n=1 Tax=Agromyces indicus TaxID=758919 RepID=A0ABU1FK30_9MICO|nr:MULTISPECIES: hypothetical protein [Agromyces]KZE94022.1 hypothetical protein AVP42_01228 [Agromyces sp. NDB4Y10]MDR5692112.1 hypothetical protein [Agromyces indicus]